MLVVCFFSHCKLLQKILFKRGPDELLRSHTVVGADVDLRGPR